MNIFVISILSSVIGVLSALLVIQNYVHAKERNIMLDRVMSKDYVQYKVHADPKKRKVPLSNNFMKAHIDRANKESKGDGS